MPRVSVDHKYCKGCGLCVDNCPKKCLVLDVDTITAKGYHPALQTNEEECNGCCTCALMCPDVAITVER